MPDHKLALHVSEGKERAMMAALSNAVNAYRYFEEAGETVAIEIVTNGAGIQMLIREHSPVGQRIADVAEQFPKIRFSVCQNTLERMGEAQGTIPQLLPEARTVPAGIARLMELQGKGYAYVKP